MKARLIVPLILALVSFCAGAAPKYNVLFLIAERSRSTSTTGPIGIGLSTIGSRRQAALLAEAGLQLRSTLVLPDGRRCVAYS